MKKVYLFTSVLLSGLSLNAQKIEKNVSIPQSRNTYTVAKAVKQNINPTAKAQGDVLWNDNFETPANWAFTAGTNQSAGTTGQWSVISTFPTSLSSQVGNYGFPTSFGTSGNKYAFINSDEAGGGKKQDAYFKFQNTIDLSSKAPGTGLYLEFDNIYRRFQETHSVEVSKDGGANWIIFPVNADVAVNSNSGNPEHEIINITSAGLAGSSNVSVRLHYVGTWDWFWGVDNIKITEAWANDALLVSSFMGTDTATSQGADYYLIPSSQVSFPGQLFTTAALNNGTATQNNFRIKASCPAAIYSEISGPGLIHGSTLAMGEIDTFSITTPFNPTDPGTYNVSVSTDLGIGTTDSYTANDTTSFRGIVIGGNDYGRDNGVMTAGFTGLSNVTAVGAYNMFNIFDDFQLGSIKAFIPTQSSTFTTDGIYCSIETWDGSAWNLLLSTDIIDITPTNDNQWHTFNSDQGITLIPGSTLIRATINYNSTSGIRIGLAQSCPSSTTGCKLDDGTTSGIIDPNAFMIRLSSDYTGGLNENTFVNSVSVYPNPAVSTANVSFNLKNNANVDITVTDVTGKVVYSNTLSNVVAGNQKVVINTESLNNGIYMVNIISNGSKTTEKFVVKK
jgi:hypothetical protein